MKNTNKNWFSILEVVIGMSIFVIFMTTRFLIDNNTLAWYQDSVRSSQLKLITNDLYAYLYTYKKEYWTSNFITLITEGDFDRNCNWNDFNSNWNLNDSIDEYCYIYPYLSGSIISFNNWIINDNNALIDDIYLLDNNNWGKDWSSYRSIFSQWNFLI